MESPASRTRFILFIIIKNSRTVKHDCFADLIYKSIVRILFGYIASRYFTENLYTVSVWYFSPFLRTVEGYAGQFGEFGKPWVSRQSAA